MTTHSLSLFDYTTEQGVVQTLANAYASGKYVSGKVKVMQAFLAEFLTARGSVRFDPMYGCDLVRCLGVTNLRSLQDAESLLASAAAEVVANMKSRYRGTEHGDERIVSARVSECIQHLDSVEAHILLTTASGDTAVLKMPVRFLPEQ